MKCESTILNGLEIDFFRIEQKANRSGGCQVQICRYNCWGCATAQDLGTFRAEGLNREYRV